MVWPHELWSNYPSQFNCLNCTVENKNLGILCTMHISGCDTIKLNLSFQIYNWKCKLWNKAYFLKYGDILMKNAHHRLFSFLTVQTFHKSQPSAVPLLFFCLKKKTFIDTRRQLRKTVFKWPERTPTFYFVVFTWIYVRCRGNSHS